MLGLLHELHGAWRALIRARTTSFVAVALIAAGIGLNTTIFSLLDTVVFRKIAVADPDRLVHVNGIVHGVFTAVPYGIIERLRARTGLFAGISGWADTPMPVEAAGNTAIALVVRVDTDMDRVLGSRPQLGRVLTRDDRGPVAVISDRFWHERLGGDPRVLGRLVRAGRIALTVVGVMPPEFTGATANVPWDVTAPLENFIGSNRPKDRVLLDTIARLAPGVTQDAARTQVEAIWPQLLAETLPEGRTLEEWAADNGRTVEVAPAALGRYFWRRQYEGPLELLLGMAILVMVIVCANIAILLSARAAGRRRETGIRLALGASRWRLAREALIETALLAGIGAVLGFIFARWGSALSVAFLPSGNVRLHYDMLNGRAFIFGAALAILAALACGLIPALRQTATSAAEAMRRGGCDSVSAGRARRVLLTLQVGLSLMLVCGALLFAASLSALSAIDLRFSPENLLVLAVQGKPGAAAAGKEYFDELFDRLRELPGVESVTAANQLPFQSPAYGLPREEVSLDGDHWATAEPHCAFSGYFAALGARMAEGREFWRFDAPTAIVNERFARQFYGSGEIVGRTLRTRQDRQVVAREIVGVVSNIPYISPAEQAPAAFYIPCLELWTPQQAAATGMGIAIRFRGRDLEREARQQLEALGRQFVIKSPRMADLVKERMLRERMMALLSSAYGGVTLAVVLLGVYGLTSFVAAARGREISVRVALGARSRHVLWLAGRELAGVLLAGMALGVVGIFLCAKLIKSYLYGLQAADPALITVALGILAATAAAAAAVPIRRALALDPVRMLRQD